MKLSFQKVLTASATAGITTIGIISFAEPASSQISPQPWESLGGEQNEISYSAGVRWFDFGAEIGGRGDGATGVDVLRFISLPVVSPYLGLGLYSDPGDDVAFSGGLQIRPPGDVFLGVGYHSVRGINGQLGIRF